VIFTPSDKDLEAWRKAMTPVWAEFEKPIGKELIDAARKASAK